MNDWAQEQQKCIKFAGGKFVANIFGYTYEWQADNVVYARLCDRKPYLIARPIRRISGKRGWLRGQQIFHAEFLPHEITH